MINSFGTWKLSRPLAVGMMVWGAALLAGAPGCSDYLGGPADGAGTSQESVADVEPTTSSEPGRKEPTPRPEPSPPDEPARPPDDGGGTDASEPSSEPGVPETPAKERQPETAVPELGPVAVRDCKVPLRVSLSQLQGHCDNLVPGQVTSVAVAGEFNQWKPGVALQPVSGDVWEGAVQTKAGDYAYKLVLNGSVWCLDPQNPKQKYSNNVLNSLISVPDCGKPLVRLERLDAPTGKGEIQADLRYVDGANQKGFAPAAVTITLNDKPLTQGVTVRADGQIRVRLKNLTPDRYTFRVTAKDKEGKASEPLYFYTWVEDKAFSWRDATLYFVFVDRFANGDPSNDAPLRGVGPIANYRGGDLQGILDKLKAGYFKDLSVNALWLSPLYEHPNTPQKGSDGRLYSGYHGYWPTEPRKVARRFGSNALLKTLVREAHKQGIRVLVDLAANHVHTDHPYWKQHQQSGWFHPFSSCAPAWDKPIVCWFDAFLPDVDYRNFAAARQMIDDAVFWAQTAELDGFRVDAVKHMRQLVMFNLRASLREQVTHDQNHFYLVGETFAGGWKGGGDLIKGFISERMLSGQFDFPMYWEILGTLGRRDGGYDFKRLDRVVKESMDAQFYGAQAVMSTFLGNHDVPRFVSHANGDIASIWGGDRNKAWQNPPSQPTSQEPYERLKAAWTLLMALPGVPLIYYGDEIALAGEGDPDNRRVMPWTNLSSQQQSVLQHLKKVAGLRRKHAALRSLDRKTLWVDAEWYAFLRTSGQERIVVVLRRGGSSSTLSLPVQGLLSNGDTVQDLLRGTSLPVKNNNLSLSLNPNQGTYLLLP